MKIVIRKRDGIETIVDRIDADIFGHFPRRGKSVMGYAVVGESGRGGKMHYIHRIIAARIIGRFLKRSEVVDHINNDPLDNRRRNIRICTQKQNVWNQRKRNTSEIKGVHFDDTRKRWKVYITANGLHYQKRFKNKQDAVEYARELREKLHGEFARHD